MQQSSRRSRSSTRNWIWRAQSHFAIAPLLLAVSLFLLAAPRAHAAPDAADRSPSSKRTVAIVSLLFFGDLSKELWRSLTTSLDGGLVAGGVHTISKVALDRRLGDQSAQAACLTPTCLAAIDRALGLEALYLRGKIRSIGSSYAIEVELLSARTAPGGDGVVARVERSCSVCTLPELHAVVSEVATELLAKVSAVEVAPASEQNRAQTSTRSSIPPPADAADGADLPKEITLERPVARKSRLPVLLLATGIATTAIGLFVWSKNGEPTCSDAGQCPRLYRTWPIGAALTAFGLLTGSYGGYRLAQNE